MWRAFFMAIGISLCLIGLECMVVEKAVLGGKPRSDSDFALIGYDLASTSATRTVSPPDWAPWSCLSAGSVILLYAALLKKGAD